MNSQPVIVKFLFLAILKINFGEKFSQGRKKKNIAESYIDMDL